MPSAVRISIVAVTVLALGVAAGAESDPQRLVGANGAWRIEAAPDRESQQENFSLATSAIGDKDASFSLSCRPAVPLYYFAVRDARLAGLPAGAEVTLTVRYPEQDPVRWQVASRGDASVVVQDRAHRTAFSIILTELIQTRATTIELSIDQHTWRFSLDGFAASMESLVQSCGFAPDQGGARARRRSAPNVDMDRGNQPDLRPPPPRTR